MQKFKAEWAAEMGPLYRGVEFEHGDREIRLTMGDDYHNSECERDGDYLRLPGERARRRRLKRTSSGLKN